MASNVRSWREMHSAMEDYASFCSSYCLAINAIASRSIAEFAIARMPAASESMLHGVRSTAAKIGKIRWLNIKLRLVARLLA